MRPVAAVLLATTVLLAGCAAPGPGDSVAPTVATAPADATSAEPAEASTSAEAAPMTLHLTPTLGLDEAPPTEPAHVRMEATLNSPMNEDRPTWRGALPRATVVGPEGITLVFHVTSNSAALAARTLPPFMFESIPAFFIELHVGADEFEAQADGPDVLLLGEAHEIRATFPTRSTTSFDEGSEVVLTIWPLYTHARDAAEIRFPLGPDHDARLTFGAG